MTTIILPDVRLSFPDLWKPGDPPAGSNSGPKFGAQGIMAKDSEAYKLALKTFIEVATAKFGPNANAIIKSLAKDKKCIRVGDEHLTKDGSVRDGYAGLMYIVARNKARPAIAAHKFANGKPVIIAEDGAGFVDGKLLQDDGQGGWFIENGGQKIPMGKQFVIVPPYGGCYVDMKVDIYAMDKPGMGKSINATLLAVQYRRKGDSFGAAPGTAEGFAENAGDGDDTNAFAEAGEDTGGNEDLFS